MTLIEQAKDQLDIVAVTAEYVQLSKAGRLFKGLCPFHEERNPSFMVDPAKQRFHCFGCGRDGDVIDFLRLIRGLGTREAVHLAASLAGVRPERPAPREVRRREREQHFRALAHRAALEAERDMPRPKGEEELSLYDLIYEEKARLDRGATWVCDHETMAPFLQALKRWRNKALRLLTVENAQNRPETAPK